MKRNRLYSFSAKYNPR